MSDMVYTLKPVKVCLDGDDCNVFDAYLVGYGRRGVVLLAALVFLMTALLRLLLTRLLFISKVIIVCLTWRFVKRVITLKQLDIIILHLKMERMILIARP